MKTDQRYPRGVIAAVGRKVRAAIEPYVERSCYVGSFRRGLPTCGDLDILLIPKSDMYASPDVSRAFAALCVGGVLESGSLRVLGTTTKRVALGPDRTAID